MRCRNRNIMVNKVWKIFPWLWLLGGMTVMLAYHIGPGKALVDGDMAGEMILADLLNQEGSLLLSDNWYYATEIHVFFLQLIFRPFLLLFPHNWHLARVLGMAVIYVINTAGYLFLCKQMGMKDWGIWSAAAFMWPVGMWRLFLGLYGGQYLVYDFFACYILGLIFYLSKIEKDRTGKAKTKVLVVGTMLLFLSLAGGLNGIRETMMLFMPICLGGGIVFIAHCYQKGVSSLKEVSEKCDKELRTFCWIVAATVLNMAGYGYNVLVLLKKYQFQSNTAMVMSPSLSLYNVLASISDFFGLFGYGGDVKLFSIKGVCCVCGILLVMLLFLTTIRLFFLKDKMSLEQEIILVTFVCGLIACGFIFGHMKEMNKPRFWLPFMVFGFMILQIEGEIENFQFAHLRGIVGIIVAVLVTVASIGTIKTEIDTPLRGKYKNMDMAAFLEENGYYQGYSDFWTGNAITALSNGNVQIRPLVYTETFELMAWSNRIDYVTTMPEGEVVYVADKKSMAKDVRECCFYKYGNGEVIVNDDDWLVIRFEEAGQMKHAYEIALANGEGRN